jgi:sugar transferase (PEP-CTERM/EpsH1 system associated)
MHSPFVDRYITVSRHLKEYLVESVGIADSRVTQISNGVDTRRFAPCANRPLHLFPEGFANPESVIIGTVGRIDKIKDQETLIRAFAILAGSGTPIANHVRLAIIGDGPLLAHLRELVESLGISRLTWLPGAISNVPEALRALDIFVLPSLLEGISNTILEAMSTRLPVLATAVGGNLELVRPGETGQLFQPRDVQSLVRLLTRYVEDSELREAHARNARQFAVQNFALSTMVDRYQKLYEDLCGRSHTS